MVDNAFIQTYSGLVHWVYFKLIPKNPLIESYKEDIIQEGINGSLYDSGNIKQAHNLLVSFFEERLKYADSLKIQKVMI